MTSLTQVLSISHIPLADVESVSQQQILAFGYLVTLIRSIHALHLRSQWQDDQSELENLS